MVQSQNVKFAKPRFGEQTSHLLFVVSVHFASTQQLIAVIAERRPEPMMRIERDHREFPDQRPQRRQERCGIGYVVHHTHHNGVVERIQALGRGVTGRKRGADELARCQSQPAAVLPRQRDHSLGQIDSDYPVRTSPSGFETIDAGTAPDIENGLTSQVGPEALECQLVAFLNVAPEPIIEQSPKEISLSPIERVPLGGKTREEFPSLCFLGMVRSHTGNSLTGFWSR